jgi:hypothetical protein
MNELDLRRTVELYRSMLLSEKDSRRRSMLSELLQQEQLKLASVQMALNSGQDF